MQLSRSTLTAGKKILQSKQLVGVTIGSFDGFHRGHQALLSRLAEELLVYPSGSTQRVLLTFEPHPRLYFAKIKAKDVSCGVTQEFLPLMTAREKIEYVRRAGFNYFVAQRFNADLASLTPEQFVKTHIVENLQAKLVVVGYDWAFGRGRQGTAKELEAICQQWGVKVVVVGAVREGGEKISSSRVREALARGEMEQVANLLSRPYSLMGRVVHGDKRGRQLGFPTANLIPQRKQLPPRGVYATRLSVGSQDYPAVTNIGIRPTFGGSTTVVETHVLEGNHELYSRLVTVRFLRRIRDEKKFASLDELKVQISLDCVAAAESHALKVDTEHSPLEVK